MSAIPSNQARERIGAMKAAYHTVSYYDIKDQGTVGALEPPITNLGMFFRSTVKHLDLFSIKSQLRNITYDTGNNNISLQYCYFLDEVICRYEEKKRKRECRTNLMCRET